MKFFSVLMTMLSFPLLANATSQETIVIQTDNTSLVYKVNDKNKLCQSYLGNRLREKDCELVPVSNDEILLTFGTG